jgi:phosphatidylglycerophosphatase A
MIPMKKNTGAAADRTQPRPRLALAIATLGLGYLPKAPGTWGSAGAVVLAAAVAAVTRKEPGAGILVAEFALIVSTAILGVWAATRVAEYEGAADPQHVVIDEVSGQTLALVIGLILSAWTLRPRPGALQTSGFAAALASGLLNWKYLLLGFILFRVFDIWKPFPARQAEFLPAGLGIMADDWIAGTYAALLLWAAWHFGL